MSEVLNGERELLFKRPSFSVLELICVNGRAHRPTLLVSVQYKHNTVMYYYDLFSSIYLCFPLFTSAFPQDTNLTLISFLKNKLREKLVSHRMQISFSIYIPACD